jgi:hypothetical protein
VLSHQQKKNESSGGNNEDKLCRLQINATFSCKSFYSLNEKYHRECNFAQKAFVFKRDQNIKRLGISI